jgi:hypothetical protein
MVARPKIIKKSKKTFRVDSSIAMPLVFPMLLLPFSVEVLVKAG